MVYVRHATDWDLVRLKRTAGEKELGLTDAPQSRIVVAVMEDEIIGFGVLDRRTESEACLVVREIGRRRGISPVIANHLLKRNLASNVSEISTNLEIFGDKAFNKTSVQLQRYYCITPAGET